MSKRLLVVLFVIFLSIPVYAESPHISLPGVSSQIDSESIIKQLVEVERIPIQKKQDEITDYEIEIKILKDFTTYVRNLDALSRSLYDYQTPFREMLGTSSDEKILQALAQRTADKAEYHVQVLQVALADSFMSDSVPRNKNLSPCQFTITIADKVIPVSFPGGTLAQLEAVIKKAAEGKVETRVVNDTSTTSVLAINGTQTGEQNKMTFGGNLTVLYEIGLLTQSVEKYDEKKIAPNRILSQNAMVIASDTQKAVIKPGNIGSYNLAADNIAVQNNTTLDFTVSVTRYSQTPHLPQTNRTAFPDLDIRMMQNVLISNITVQGGRIIPFYQEPQTPQPQATAVSNFTDVLSILFADGTVKTVSVSSNGSYSIPLALYAGRTIAKLTLRNDNTDREYVFSDIRFLTRTSEGGVQPKNPISRACDSILSIDGVRATRDNNEIDDLIKGVVLYLKKASPDDVTVTVDHNYDNVKQKILEWVNAYNQVMEYLSILTTPTLDRTPLHERTEDAQRNGIYQAESSFTSLRSKLRLVSMNAYPTDLGREMTLLEQIGIFTKRAGNFDVHSADWQTTQMGLLQIDTDSLDKALKEHFKQVEQLFANDTDGDIIRDNGVAYFINQTLQLALGTTGFLDKKIQSNTDKIKQLRLEIDDLNRKLADYEADLRRRYGQMNQTISETQSQQRWLNSQTQNRQ